MEQRFDAALRASRDPQIIGAPDGRYFWSLETKAVCGIAIGFLKAHEVDEDSVNKCDNYSKFLTLAPPPPGPPPPPPQPPPPPVCPVKLPIIFYFGFDVDQPPPEAQPVAQDTVSNMAVCHWSGFNVVGHTDLSGSVAYNQRLSERRAHNIAGLLTAAGAPAGSLDVRGMGKSQPAVSTADGVREPLNRRVEVTPSGQ
ncbi:MAG TPA: OmpA family protein [Caulobacteraceae bacterium]|nr:OmpA family protein [Caulobacteraceae bacterium]